MFYLGIKDVDIEEMDLDDMSGGSTDSEGKTGSDGKTGDQRLLKHIASPAAEAPKSISFCLLSKSNLVAEDQDEYDKLFSQTETPQSRFPQPTNLGDDDEYDKLFSQSVLQPEESRSNHKAILAAEEPDEYSKLFSQSEGNFHADHKAKLAAEEPDEYSKWFSQSEGNFHADHKAKLAAEEPDEYSKWFSQSEGNFQADHKAKLAAEEPDEYSKWFSQSEGDFEGKPVAEEPDIYCKLFLKSEGDFRATAVKPSDLRPTLFRPPSLMATKLYNLWMAPTDRPDHPSTVPMETDTKPAASTPNNMPSSHPSSAPKKPSPGLGLELAEDKPEPQPSAKHEQRSADLKAVPENAPADPEAQRLVDPEANSWDKDEESLHCEEKEQEEFADYYEEEQEEFVDYDDLDVVLLDTSMTPNTATITDNCTTGIDTSSAQLLLDLAASGTTACIAAEAPVAIEEADNDIRREEAFDAQYLSRVKARKYWEYCNENTGKSIRNYEPNDENQTEEEEHQREDQMSAPPLRAKARKFSEFCKETEPNDKNQTEEGDHQRKDQMSAPPAILQDQQFENQMSAPTGFVQDQQHEDQMSAPLTVLQDQQLEYQMPAPIIVVQEQQLEDSMPAPIAVSVPTAESEDVALEQQLEDPMPALHNAQLSVPTAPRDGQVSAASTLATTEHKVRNMSTGALAIDTTVPLLQLDPSAPSPVSYKDPAKTVAAKIKKSPKATAHFKNFVWAKQAHMTRRTKAALARAKYGENISEERIREIDLKDLVEMIDETEDDMREFIMEGNNLLESPEKVQNY